MKKDAATGLGFQINILIEMGFLFFVNEKKFVVFFFFISFEGKQRVLLAECAL
jgi:hypothetical protein